MQSIRVADPQRGHHGIPLGNPCRVVAHAVPGADGAHRDDAGLEPHHWCGLVPARIPAVEEDPRPNQVTGKLPPDERGRAVGRVHQSRSVRQRRYHGLEAPPLQRH